MSAPEQRKLWNTKAAAEAMGIPYRTLMALIDRGELEYVRIGRYYLIPDAALDAFIQARLVPARRSAVAA